MTVYELDGIDDLDSDSDTYDEQWADEDDEGPYDQARLDAEREAARNDPMYLVGAAVVGTARRAKKTQSSTRTMWAREEVQTTTISKTVLATRTSRWTNG